MFTDAPPLIRERADRLEERMNLTESARETPLEIMTRVKEIRSATGRRRFEKGRRPSDRRRRRIDEQADVGSRRIKAAKTDRVEPEARRVVEQEKRGAILDRNRRSVAACNAVSAGERGDVSFNVFVGGVMVELAGALPFRNVDQHPSEARLQRRNRGVV